MAPDSFKSEFTVPPTPRPGTPERITAAIEPIPEAAFKIAELLKRESSHRRPTTRRPPALKTEKRNAKGSSSRGHRHNNSATFAIPPASPIDTLASVAAFEATSRSPPTFHNLYQSQYPFERPSKRARSEIAPSPQLPIASPLFDHGTTTRPATSYNGWGYNVEQGINHGQRVRAYSAHTRTGSIAESNVDEAELLLNFSRGGGTSSSHGLGISSASALVAQPVQRTPALPPFPFTTSGQTAWITTGSAQPQSPTSPTQPAPPHSPISPPANLSVPKTRVETQPIPSELLPVQDAISPPLEADRMDVDTVEAKAEPVDSAMADAPPVANGVEESHDNSRLNTVPEQIAKLPPTALRVPDVDGRRYSDSHQDNSLKRVRLEDSRRSSSVPLEYAMSETTEPSVAVDSTNSEDAAKVPEQGVICPACNNAGDLPSEKVDWLQCDGCDQWYHVTCSGLTPKQSKVIDKYYCKTCEPKFGKSTSRYWHRWKGTTTNIFIQTNARRHARAIMSIMLVSTKECSERLATTANITTSRSSKQTNFRSRLSCFHAYQAVRLLLSSSRNATPSTSLSSSPITSILDRRSPAQLKRKRWTWMTIGFGCLIKDKMTWIW